MHGIVLQLGFNLFALAYVAVGQDQAGLFSAHQKRGHVH